MIISIFLAAYTNGHAQCFAQVSLDRSSVYVQQPFRITITVLTATWYTAPLDFDNIQIPNTFMLSFDRTIPGMFTVNNRQYAGLQFYFIAFPYRSGNFSIPSIHIVAETPPVGSSQSRKVTIKTEAKNFTVKPVPENMHGENWFVAKNVFVSERWSKPLNNLKVGDIIQRTITIDAKGTLPQFIPQLSKDSLDFASSYLRDATLHDERNDYDANGKLEQSVIYLLEKEGDFTIPAIPVEWWNPNSSKRYSRSAAARNIHVGPNPNLGIVATLKDSLQLSQPVGTITSNKKTTKTFFGIAWYWFIVMLLAVMILLYELVRLIVRQVKNYKIRRARYILGESYAFKQFMHSPLDMQVLLNHFYRWWDKLAFRGKSASPSWQMRQDHFGNIQNDLGNYLKNLYGPESNHAMATAEFKNEIRKYREEIKLMRANQDDKISGFQVIDKK